ncbi:PHD finger protein [Forsythia ovata]|uniref:PHD finger protein n=1 Tax=Forsythia ovata TaxID=205694 RepID=A0ABD1U6J5_9LAMI
MAVLLSFALTSWKRMSPYPDLFIATSVDVYDHKSLLVKVSVMDVSKKHMLELRQLHAITKGHAWYGDWDYEFGAGSFALTHDDYKMAVKDLSSLLLSMFLSQGRKPRTYLQDLISFYQSISEHELVNISYLFCFLTSLIHNAHKCSLRFDGPHYKKLKTCESRVLCSWTVNDIARVEEAMFKVLRAISGSTWVSWHALEVLFAKLAVPSFWITASKSSRKNRHLKEWLSTPVAFLILV